MAPYVDKVLKDFDSRTGLPDAQGRDIVIMCAEYLLHRFTLDPDSDLALANVFLACLKWTADQMPDERFQAPVFGNTKRSHDVVAEALPAGSGSGSRSDDAMEVGIGAESGEQESVSSERATESMELSEGVDGSQVEREIAMEEEQVLVDREVDPVSVNEMVEQMSVNAEEAQILIVGQEEDDDDRLWPVEPITAVCLLTKPSTLTRRRK